MRPLPALMLAALLSACTTPAPPPAATAAAPAPLAAPRPGPNVEAEVAQLRASLVAEVPHAMLLAPSDADQWILRTQAAVRAADFAIDRPELLVVVDRAPSVQALMIVLARPDGPWEVIGGSRVSTGQSGRRGYFITPTGVFPHTDAILDYRAEGTYNENHIRGLGVRGMRVWDFGWQTAEKGWTATPETGEIRLLMHATDPDVLEPRIGRPASKGCVRIPAAMNVFLDRHGVLDADIERAAQDDRRFAAVLRPDRVPTPLAGDALVVIDSGTAPPPLPAAPVPTATLPPLGRAC
ncbi:MAG: L,D-transpeptidase [Rhodospirillales bacterium]|nr:L,D-transpeptidase [Rhodospirillales bacterium]